MQITEDEFFNNFKPITNPHNGTLVFETFGAEHNFVRNQPENTVWTLLDDNSIVSGYHWANRVGYYVTEVPWTQETNVQKDSGQLPD